MFECGGTGYESVFSSTADKPLQVAFLCTALSVLCHMWSRVLRMQTGKSSDKTSEKAAQRQWHLSETKPGATFPLNGYKLQRAEEEHMGDGEQNGPVPSVSPLCYSLWMRWVPIHP